MNLTDDDQPLGEAPIIEMSMAELADRIDHQGERAHRQTVALAKISELHRECSCALASCCIECGSCGDDERFPCETRRLADEAGVL